MTSYVISRDRLEEMSIFILSKWMKFETLLSFIQTYSGKKVGGFFLSFSELETDIRQIQSSWNPGILLPLSISCDFLGCS